MNTRPSVSLSFVLARESTKTVILRRGPSKLTRCILWDRSDDSFEDGQWLKGPLEVSKFGLTPDANYLIYSTIRYVEPGIDLNRYTVISRPPWFTALALFPFNISGSFLDNTRFFTEHREDVADVIGKAVGLHRAFKTGSSDTDEINYRHDDGSRVHLDKMNSEYLSGQRELALPSEYVSDKGCLFRKSENKKSLIRDFTDMVFEPIRAPYDDRPQAGDDMDTPGHPLDRENP